MGEVLAAMQAAGFSIVDVATREADLEDAISNRGFRGLRLDPVRHGYALNEHQIVYPLIDVCQKLHVPVWCYGAADVFSTPILFAPIAEKYPDVDLIINVQGDEPLIEPKLIDELAAAFDGDADLQMATVCTEITDEAEQQNPNNVKVVMDKQGYALYFSRSLMPYPRHPGTPVYKHIGIYAYKRDFLLAYAKMAETPLEHAESLEQLRALENGYRIKVIKTPYRFVGVDTAEDLAKVNAIYRQMMQG